MSQHARNQPGEGQGSPGRGMNDGRERARIDGFEGMNYEQIRQPYNPQRTGNNTTEEPDQKQGTDEKG